MDKLLYLLLLVALTVSCDSGSSLPDDLHEAPGPLKGFTDFPHDGTFDGILSAYETIERDANLVAQHYDGGVPWPEAYSGAAYSQSFRDEISAKVQLSPESHLMYLAVTPIHFDRNGLAAYRGAMQGEPLPEDWDDDTFDTLKVRQAYLSYCREMIRLHSPDYFVYAIEANILHTSAVELWSGFVGLAEYVYTSLKDSISIPIGISLQAEFYWEDSISQRAALDMLWPFTDFVGISAYPYVAEPNPDSLRSEYFSIFTSLSGGKELAIAETAWPAEPIGSPYPVTIPADEPTQVRYVEAMLTGRLSTNWLFVNWFFTRDFDDYWDAGLNTLPNAATVRLWKDTGLLRGDGSERPALSAWRAY